MSLKVAVLLGGTSAERDVSLVTGIEISRALNSIGYRVEAIDCAFGTRKIDFLNQNAGEIIKNTPSQITDQKENLDQNLLETVQYLKEDKIDAVFIALHGGYGENGKLQALLELFQIPFTGTGSLASGLGMDKNLSKMLFQHQNIPTAKWMAFNRLPDSPEQSLKKLAFPLVVKPNDQGSTVGLSIIRKIEDAETAFASAKKYSDSVLFEEYIAGRELTVSILDCEPLPIIEIIPESGLYDYESKYQSGKSKYIVPAELPDEITKSIQKNALKAFNILGCRHYGRVDFRLDKNFEAFCLEVNTLPGMTSTSLVPKAAKTVGIEFPQLISKIVQMAVR